MCGNFVLCDIGADEIARKIAPGAGRACPADVYLVRNLKPHFIQPLFYRLKRPSGRHEIPAGQDVFVLVDYDDVRADGTHVYPNVSLHLFAFRNGMNTIDDRVMFRP